jgi:hypothetical protein
MQDKNTLQMAAELLEKIHKLTSSLRARLESFEKTRTECVQELEEAKTERTTN